jgi:hypothetical protein
MILISDLPPDEKYWNSFGQLTTLITKTKIYHYFVENI